MARLITSLVASIAGVAMLLAGLGIDAWLHAQDETLAAREGVFTLSNPGHLMLALGIATTCAGTLSALYIAWGMTKGQGILGRRWLRVIAMQVAGAASAGAVIFTLAVSTAGHEHAHTDTAMASSAHAHENNGSGEHVTLTASTEMNAQAPVSEPGTNGHAHPNPTTGNGMPTAPSLPPDPMASSAPHAHHNGGAQIPADTEGIEDHSNDDAALPDAGEKHPHNHPTATAEELACLRELTTEAKAATARFVDFDVAVTEGYREPAEPGGTHYPNRRYMLDGRILDLGSPESLIYRTNAMGERQLVGALYRAPRNEGAKPCGNATWWHTHDGCIDPVAKERSDMPPSGICPEGTVLREARIEMMHLWFVPRRQQ